MTREEAIRILASSCIPGSKQTEALETLIPELAEGEDERIRKQLIDAIKIGRSNSGISFTEEAASRYIAWLEKQKPAEVDESTKRLNDNWMRQHFDDYKERESAEPSGKLSRQDYLYQLLIDQLITYSDYEYLIGQKPNATINGEPIPTENHSVDIPLAEWSEEDEDNLCRVIRVLEDNDSDWKELSNWLKSLRPVKQEWSEDERKILDSIIDDYEKAERSFCGYAGKIGFLRAIRDGEYGLSKQKWSEEDEK